MKVTAHVNLGNYESIKVESGAYDTVTECRAELDVALAAFREPRVEEYRKRITLAEVS